MDPTADELIALHGLAPHPEGGHYRRIHASQVQVDVEGQPRPAMTAIVFLLAAGERSRWHRVDADEAWHWQQGGALALQIYEPGTDRLVTLTLAAAGQGHQAHAIVPAGAWQRAWPLDQPALVVCTVAPGFVWEGFALLDAAPQVAARLQALGAGEPAGNAG